MPLRLDQLTKRFDAKVAVDRVSLSIRPRELLVVTGAPGSGRSTLLRLLAGLEEPSSGTIHAGGADLAAGAAESAADAAESAVGTVEPAAGAGESAAGVSEPAAGAAESGAGASGPSAGSAEPAAGAATRTIAFASLTAAGTLEAGAGASASARASGAAGTLPAGPDACILLDEPLAALRGPERAAARDALRALPAGRDAAVVCALGAGDEADALAVADRIAVLDEGRLRQCGTPAEVVDAPADEVVAAFFGRPRINLVPAILEKDGQALLLGNQTVSLAGRIEEIFCRDVTLGIRPGHVRLTRDGVGLRGRVRATEPFGDATLVRVDVEGVSIRALDSGREPLRAGDAVRVRVDPRHYVVFDDHGVRLDQR